MPTTHLKLILFFIVYRFNGIPQYFQWGNVQVPTPIELPNKEDPLPPYNGRDPILSKQPTKVPVVEAPGEGPAPYDPQAIDGESDQALADPQVETATGDDPQAQVEIPSDLQAQEELFEETYGEKVEQTLQI